MPWLVQSGLPRAIVIGVKMVDTTVAGTRSAGIEVDDTGGAEKKAAGAETRLTPIGADNHL